MLYRLEVPETGGGEAVRGFIESWVDQPALRRTVEAEGGSWPRGSLEARVESLHEFSERWDFRGGGERLDIATGRIGIDAATLRSAAVELGMAAARPPVDAAYDHALVLGGTALANVYRLRRLYELRDGGLEVGRVAALTALREIGEAELRIVRERPEVAAIVAEGPGTEFEVMIAAIEHFSGARAVVEPRPDPNPNLASARAQVGDAVVVAAPSADPDRRANSRDNYAAYSSSIGPADSVLVVTSSIYLPYQFFVALQEIGWRQPRTIEAVGFPPEWMGSVLTGPENVLQELRSALFGARSTLRALAVEDPAS
jgi:hypothetical protein